MRGFRISKNQRAISHAELIDKIYGELTNYSNLTAEEETEIDRRVQLVWDRWEASTAAEANVEINTRRRRVSVH